MILFLAPNNGGYGTLMSTGTAAAADDPLPSSAMLNDAPASPQAIFKINFGFGISLDPVSGPYSFGGSGPVYRSWVNNLQTPVD